MARIKEMITLANRYTHTTSNVVLEGNEFKDVHNKLFVRIRRVSMHMQFQFPMFNPRPNDLRTRVSLGMLTISNAK